MGNKFRIGQAVREKGKTQRLVIAEIEPDGQRYMVKEDSNAVTKIGWVEEKNLEIFAEAYPGERDFNVSNPPSQGE